MFKEDKEKLEVGKLEGDQPFYIDYGYTSQEYSMKLEIDRLTNALWKESGYVFNTEEK